MRVLRVPPEHAGTRLDRFVAKELRATSRSRSQLIIARGAYSPDGRHLRKNHRLTAEERVVLWREACDGDTPGAELTVLYEDSQLLAVDKPPFVTVHPTARLHHSTLVVLLSRQRPGEHVTLLHRIDRETSGVLLLARTREADRRVKIQFEERKSVLKRYLALTWGWPEWDRCRCELPLELDRENPLRIKMRVAPSPPPLASPDAVPAPTAASGRPLAAATTFDVLARRTGADSGKRYAMLRCTLHTGRQHQIRVHLAALGLPVVGDKLYGPDETMIARAADGELTADDLVRLELPRHALHAESLELEHPTTGLPLRISSPLPADLRGFWEGLALP